MSQSQFREFVGQMVRALPDDLPPTVMKRWIESPGDLRQALREALVMNVPLITVMGNEDLDLPNWVWKVEKDVTAIVGTLELEIIELLEPSEEHISGEEMQRRAEAKDANLDLRHAQAFLAEYPQESFGLPEGTYITFPGTVVVDEHTRRAVPVLNLRGSVWCLAWHGLTQDWFQGNRLARLRA